MEAGDILGHEPMGVMVEAGSAGSFDAVACKTFRDKKDGCIKVVLKP